MIIDETVDNCIESPRVGSIVRLDNIPHDKSITERLKECGLYQFAPSQRENKLLDIWQFARSEPESTIDTTEMIKNLFNPELDLIIETAGLLVGLGLQERRRRHDELQK